MIIIYLKVIVVYMFEFFLFFYVDKLIFSVKLFLCFFIICNYEIIGYY